MTVQEILDLFKHYPPEMEVDISEVNDNESFSIQEIDQIEDEGRIIIYWNIRQHDDDDEEIEKPKYQHQPPFDMCCDPYPEENYEQQGLERSL